MTEYYFTYKDYNSNQESFYITLKILANNKYDAYNEVLGLIDDNVDLSECFEMAVGKTNFLSVNSILEDKKNKIKI